MSLRANIAARAASFVEWFIPERIRAAGAEERRRARVLVAFTLAVMLAGCPYAAFYYWHGVTGAAVIVMLAIVVAPWPLFVMRGTGSSHLPANLSIATMFACLTGLAFYLGGPHATPLLWYSAIPLIAVSLAGRRAAIIWTVAAVASLTAMMIIDSAGFTFRDGLSPEGHVAATAVVLLGLTVLTLMLANLLELFKERALREVQNEKAFSEDVVNSLPGVFYLFAADGRFMRWNDNFQKISGYSAEELAEMQPWDFFQGDGRRQIAEAIQEVFETGENSAEADFYSKDGRSRPYFFTGRLASPEGKPCLVGMGLDITDRKRAERRAAALSQLNADLLEIADFPAKLQRVAAGVVDILGADFARIWITKRGDRCDDGCVHAKAAEGPHVCRHRDTCLHLLASAGRYTHLDGDVHRRVPFGCYKIGRLASGAEPKFVTNDVTQDPRVHNNEWAAELGLASFAGYQLLSSDGSPVGALALFSKQRIDAEDDLLLQAVASTTSHVVQRALAEETAHERAQLLSSQNIELEAHREQLEAQRTELVEMNQELDSARLSAEAATRSKSEFLANMSHEIRTPMTAIMGFADVLLEQGDLEKAPPNRLDAAQTIKRNGHYLLSLINDILDISKIEAGKMAVEQIPCSPSQIVAEVASLMRVRCDSKNLQFGVESEGAIPETVRTDPVRLRQILVNVIGNAIKFTERGAVRLIGRLTGDSAAPLLQFDVVDSGIGMTPQQVSRLFNPFTQADATTTRQYGGTGLGLTISKRLAAMLGGDVSIVETKPDVGTRVRITIGAGSLANVRLLEDALADAVVAQGGSPAKSLAAAKQGVDCRILLAEDGPDNQRLIAHILRKWGAHVTIVENGSLAVDAALAAHVDSAPFDVILMDMQMPEMDGYEATRTLRSQGYTGPIVALTANAMVHDRDKCLQAGCDDYASKPIDRSELMETIQRWRRGVETRRADASPHIDR